MLFFVPVFFTGWMLIFLDLILFVFSFYYYFLKFLKLDSVSNLLFLVFNI